MGRCTVGTSLLVFARSLELFVGSIPSSFSLLTKLRSLIIYGSSMTGSLPELIGFSSLSKLFIQTNSFVGSLPASYGSLSELVTFEISKCLLTGTIPPSFSALTKLSSLSLVENKLTSMGPRAVYLRHLSLFKQIPFHGCAP